VLVILVLWIGAVLPGYCFVLAIRQYLIAPRRLNSCVDILVGVILESDAPFGLLIGCQGVDCRQLDLCILSSHILYLFISTMQTRLFRSCYLLL